MCVCVCVEGGGGGYVYFILDLNNYCQVHIQVAAEQGRLECQLLQYAIILICI